MAHAASRDCRRFPPALCAIFRGKTGQAPCGATSRNTPYVGTAAAFFKGLVRRPASTWPSDRVRLCLKPRRSTRRCRHNRSAKAGRRSRRFRTPRDQKFRGNREFGWFRQPTLGTVIGWKKHCFRSLSFCSYGGDACARTRNQENSGDTGRIPGEKDSSTQASRIDGSIMSAFFLFTRNKHALSTAAASLGKAGRFCQEQQAFVRAPDASESEGGLCRRRRA